MLLEGLFLQAAVKTDGLVLLIYLLSPAFDATEKPKECEPGRNEGSGKSDGVGPTLPLPSCVTLGKSLRSLGSQFPQLERARERARRNKNEKTWGLRLPQLLNHLRSHQEQ